MSSPNPFLEPESDAALVARLSAAAPRSGIDASALHYEAGYRAGLAGVRRELRLYRGLAVGSAALLALTIGVWSWRETAPGESVPIASPDPTATDAAVVEIEDGPAVDGKVDRPDPSMIVAADDERNETPSPAFDRFRLSPDALAASQALERRWLSPKSPLNDRPLQRIDLYQFTSEPIATTAPTTSGESSSRPYAARSLDGSPEFPAGERSSRRRNLNVRTLSIALAAILLLPCACWAQNALWAPGEPHDPRPDVPDRVPLAVTPALEPVPALKYRLLPTSEERTRGNAATNYYRALLHLKELPREYFQPEVDNATAWTEDPLNAQSAAAIKNYLSAFRTTFEEVRTAVYREKCEWNLELEQLRGPDVVMYLLHDFQEMRQIARLLELRFRVELYEDRVDDAWETLRQGTQLGVDCAKPPLLINGLIGIAIDSIMLHRLNDFVAHPDAPNVYWALAALSEPLIDLRPAIEFEMNIGPRIFPSLVDPERARPADEWRRDLQEVVKTIETVSSNTSLNGDPDSAQNRMAVGAMMLGYAATRYPAAKSLLYEAGYGERAVDGMPVAQALMLAEKIYYARISDEMMKYFYLPMAERLERDDEIEPRLREMTEREPIPIAALLLPAIGAAAKAQDRLVYRVRGSMTVEALREEAAATGKFPNRLQDLRTLPAPRDPYTGENFAYQSTGDRATLSVIIPRGPQSGVSKIYELKLREPAAKDAP